MKLFKSALVFTLVSSLIMTAMPVFASPPNASFSDVAGKHWASKQIKTLANWQVISGEAGGKYKPESNLRRSELAKLLTIAFQLQKGAEGTTPTIQIDSTDSTKTIESKLASNLPSLKDVESNHWAIGYIAGVLDAKWMAGFPDACFKPEEYTTRAQIAKILCQARGFSIDTTSTATFKDVSSKHWALKYIEAAATNKLLNGYAGGLFKPDNRVTRAEAAALIYRALEGTDFMVETAAGSGVTYERYRRFSDNGALNIHVLNIPKSAGVSAKLGLAKDRVTGLERVSSMATRYGALAAINGDFFSTDGKSGSSGILVDSQLISSPLNSRSYFGIGPDNAYFIDRATMQATITASNGKKGLISWVNKCRDSFTDTIVAYTPAYGPTTKTTTDTGTEVVLKLDNMPLVPSADVTATVVEVRGNNGNTHIPSDGIVLSGIGSSKAYLDSYMKVGDSVKLSFAMNPAMPNDIIAVGGGPRLVRDGIAGVESEGFSSISGRRARTGIGYDSKGNLIMVVVDGGISNFSIGMTLSELAQELKSRGAIDAMNLDGGTSTTLFFNGSIRNYPGQGEGERAVCSSLLIMPQ